jgi:hypothetical protein
MKMRGGPNPGLGCCAKPRIECPLRSKTTGQRSAAKSLNPFY